MPEREHVQLIDAVFVWLERMHPRDITDDAGAMDLIRDHLGVEFYAQITAMVVDHIRKSFPFRKNLTQLIANVIDDFLLKFVAQSHRDEPEFAFLKKNEEGGVVWPDLVGLHTLGLATEKLQ